MINNYNDITNFEYLIDLLSEEHISKITEKYKGDENSQKIVPIVSYSAISRNDSERNPEIFVDIFNLAAEKLLSMPNKFSD